MSTIRQRIRGWVHARNEKGNLQQLGSRNIYILPSAFGWVYLIMLLSIGIGAINYQLNPAFLFVFLLMVIGILSMWETHRNLMGLSIRCLPIDDTQEAQSAKVTLLILNETSTRFGILVSFDAYDKTTQLAILTKGENALVLSLETAHRGCFKLPRINFYTYYPLGLFRAWGYAYFDTTYYVYPQATSPGFWPEKSGDNSQQHRVVNQGEDELYDVKTVANPWVQPSRIAWKISARGQGWYLKTMTSPAGENWLFRIEDLNMSDLELNLKQLSYWVQTADKLGHLYGLELKGKRTEISRGKQHLKRCLRQLAIY